MTPQPVIDRAAPSSSLAGSAENAPPWLQAEAVESHKLRSTSPTKRKAPRRKLILADAKLNRSCRYLDWTVFAATVIVGLSVASAKAADASLPSERPAIELVVSP
jgi:hypothetical protein